MQIPRPEYPRPQFVRSDWLNLNGTWNFQLDPTNQGLDGKWFANPKLSGTIQVPYAYQSQLSQVADKTTSDWCWYHRNFTLPQSMAGKEIILHFGAVDYECQVYVNGAMVGAHEGGHTAFSFDITPYLTGDATITQQALTIRVYDPLTDETIPRGKQHWEEKSQAIWYTQTTGIWQTVWLEAVEKTHVKSLRFTPKFDNGSVAIEADIAGDYSNSTIAVEIKFKGEVVARCVSSIVAPTFKIELDVFGNSIYRSAKHNYGRAWWPESPNLFDVLICVHKDDREVDFVKSYFGMRKIHTEKGKIYLNNRPYYQKLVLDQGYWPQGLLTAPTDEDFVTDITLAKEMGFNGCRKHQKVEDPRFLYHADKLGFLVWGECAAAQCFSNNAITRLTKEWLEIIERDYNHPCIVTWVPYNESWGVPNVNCDVRQQEHTMAMYYLIKSLDPTRLVISNDGWELTKTDIVSVHNYSHGHENETEVYNRFTENLSNAEKLLSALHCGKNIFANGFCRNGEPFMLTEFGGIAYEAGSDKGWGYTTAGSPEQLLADLRRIMEAIAKSESLHGYCYTQLTDVEQEINGLLTYDRKPKCDLAKIKELQYLR